jgi:hypothetical protein
MRGYGSVVDDTPSSGLLAFHELEGLLSTQEGTGQVDVDYGTPLLRREILQ